MARRDLSYQSIRSYIIWGVVSSLTLVVLVGFIAIPVRTWSYQTAKKDATKKEMAQIEEDIAGLEQELINLQSDDEIERRARKDFGLVFPGEESYRVVK